MTDSSLLQPEQPADTAPNLPSLATTVSGGVDLDAAQISINGDVAGRDKIESAGGHIIHAGAGATVIVTERSSDLPRSPSDEPPAPGEPPFKGLQYFDEADAKLFFGRETLSAQLVVRLHSEAFLAVVGASGSGKSSLVRAGLMPVIRRDCPRWLIHVITPTAHPLKELAASLTRDVESLTATATLIDDLARDERCLDLAAAKLLKRSSPNDRLLLIVDQFEELFTACKDDLERRAFIDNLLHAVAANTAGATTVVIALRADFYAHCARFDALRQALEQHQAFIGPMTREELRRAIEAPAQQANWHFQPGLVNVMLHDVGHEPGALPLLSHALLATWEKRRGRTLTLEGYTETGGVNGAIAKTADAVVQALSPDQRAVARSIFLRLTELGEGTQDTRRRVTLAELAPRPELALATQHVLTTLADARLIITSEDVAEVAHEALIREWPTLRGWLDEDREVLRLRRQLTADAREWLTLQRDEGALYRGTRLDRAVGWVERRVDELTPTEREFFEASVNLRQREQDAREERHRQELAQARQMAEIAQARARAERRAFVMARWLAVMSVALLVALGGVFTPTLYEVLILRGQAVSADPLAEFPAVEALLGATNGQPGDYLALQPYALAPYAIERYEVTNRRYMACVQSQICTPPAASPDQYDPSVAPDIAELPVVNVTVLQAGQFCKWLGLRLPTELEWERAARGSNGRSWPWGQELPAPDRANFYYGVSAHLQPVGQAIAGTTPEGLYDLAGNAWEWTSSSFDLAQPIWDGSPNLPKALSVRGGGANFSAESMTTIALRLAVAPTTPNPFIGFRCAVSR